MPHVEDGIGWKGTDTSLSAAKGMVPSAATVRARVASLLNRAHPATMTADEITDALGLDSLTVRPRISELREAGRVKDSGERRPGDRGRNQVAWRYAPRKKET